MREIQIWYDGTNILQKMILYIAAIIGGLTIGLFIFGEPGFIIGLSPLLFLLYFQFGSNRSVPK